MPKRFMFSVDAATLKDMADATKAAGFSSQSATVREAVAVYRLLQKHIAAGFTQIVVRNPATEAEAVLFITSLRR